MESFFKLVNRFLSKFKKSGQERGMTVHAVITRADGTVEDLGLVAKGQIKNFDINDFLPSGGK